MVSKLQRLVTTNEFKWKLREYMMSKILMLFCAAPLAFIACKNPSQANYAPANSNSNTRQPTAQTTPGGGVQQQGSQQLPTGTNQATAGLVGTWSSCEVDPNNSSTSVKNQFTFDNSGQGRFATTYHSGTACNQALTSADIQTLVAGFRSYLQGEGAPENAITDLTNEYQQSLQNGSISAFTYVEKETLSGNLKAIDLTYAPVGDNPGGTMYTSYSITSQGLQVGLACSSQEISQQGHPCNGKTQSGGSPNQRATLLVGTPFTKTM